MYQPAGHAHIWYENVLAEPEETNMLLRTDAISSIPPPPPPKPPPPAPPPRHEPQPPMAPDRMKKSDPGGPLVRLEDFVKTEWASVAGAAHGLTTVPGVVAHSYMRAAEANMKFATQLDEAVKSWLTESASTRQAKIVSLIQDAKGESTAVEDLAAKLSAANAMPRAIEAVMNPLEKALGAIGKLGSSSLAATIDRAPQALQSPLRSLANRFESSAASFYSNIKNAADDAMHSLPVDLATKGQQVTDMLKATAAADSAKASGLFKNISRTLGTTAGDVTSLAHNGAVDGVMQKVGFLRETPVLGLVLAGGSTAYDATHGISLPDAAVANFGSTFIGTAVGSAVSDGLASGIASAAITDGGAELAGAVIATGPAGWAVAGGVVAAAAVGYGAYKVIESQAGQDVIDGVAHLDGHQIVKGLDEGGADIAHGAEAVGRGAVHIGEDIGSGVSSGISAVGNLLGI